MSPRVFDLPSHENHWTFFSSLPNNFVFMLNRFNSRILINCSRYVESIVGGMKYKKPTHTQQSTKTVAAKAVEHTVSQFKVFKRFRLDFIKSVNNVAVFVG